MKKKLVRGLGVVTVFAFALMFLGPALPVLVAHASGGPTLSISAPVDVPGANVVVSGSGFGSGETVQINFGSHSTTVVADSTGSFSNAVLPIPMVPAGLQFVSAFGETSGRWSLSYLWIAGYTPKVSPSAWYVLPGQPITFTGTGFAPHEAVNATYSGNSVGSSTTDGSGGFTLAGVSLPLSLHNTSATISFVGAVSDVSASTTLAIGQLYPSLTPSVWYTAPGSVISLSGNGFAPNEEVVVSSGGSVASTTASASGSFVLGAFSLPKVVSATAIVTATGQESAAIATADIALSQVSPWLTFSTYWAQGGSPLTIFGNGFVDGESVGIMSGTQDLGTTTAAGNGGFSFNGVVPFAPPGPVTIHAIGASSGALGSGTITVAPVYTDFELGSYAVAAGSAIDFIGHGYLPNEPVTITTNYTGSTPVLTITADSSGNFNNSSYNVPTNTPSGTMTVSAEGMHSFSTKSVTLYIGN